MLLTLGPTARTLPGHVSEHESGWDWSKVVDDYWRVPAPDVYYLLHRWRDARQLRILDLGCGPGRHSLLFARNGFEVTASDVADSGLDALRAAAREEALRIEVVRADARRLPFADQSFDAILAFQSIYHVDSTGMARVIAEIRRVLCPSGEAFITFISKTAPSFHDGSAAIVDDNVRLKKEEEGTTLPHFYVDRDDLRLLLGGFEIVLLRQIEDVMADRSGWHYVVLARPAPR